MHDGPSIYCIPVLFLPEEGVRNDEAKVEAGLPALRLTLPDQAQDRPYIVYLYCFSLKRE